MTLRRRQRRHRVSLSPLLLALSACGTTVTQQATTKGPSAAAVGDELGHLPVGSDESGTSGFGSEATFKGLVRYYNRRGGLGGRQTAPVIYNADASNSSYEADASAACATFTQDNHVAAVISATGDFWSDNYTSCLTKARVPHLLVSLGSTDAQGFADNPSMFATSTVSVDARLTAMVQAILWTSSRSRRRTRTTSRRTSSAVPRRWPASTRTSQRTLCHGSWVPAGCRRPTSPWTGLARRPWTAGRSLRARESPPREPRRPVPHRRQLRPLPLSRRRPLLDQWRSGRARVDRCAGEPRRSGAEQRDPRRQQRMERTAALRAAARGRLPLSARLRVLPVPVATGANPLTPARAIS